MQLCEVSMLPNRANGVDFSTSLQALPSMAVDPGSCWLLDYGSGAVHGQNDFLAAGQSEYKGRRIAQVMGAAGPIG